MNVFVDNEIEKKINFKPISLDKLIEMMNTDEKERKSIDYLFEMMKKLPASVRGYHGTYEGGLYDHVILVTNISLNIKKLLSENKILETDLVKASLYHDLGKIDTYSRRNPWKMDFEFRVKEKDIGLARFHAQTQFGVRGKDPHVERCFVIMKYAGLTQTEEVLHAITFHHGGWSGYFPKKGGKLASLLHSADLIAANYLKI